MRFYSLCSFLLAAPLPSGKPFLLVKALAAIIDWLLFLSVYLIGSKFFSKKVGAIAAVLLMLCFPLYEANAFGGYTTLLGVAFLLLVLLYLPLAVEKFGYLLVTFFVSFALVLSHQLATFVAVFILVPVLLYMLIKSRGASIKVVLALILGGGIAFFLYYFQAVFAYIGIALDYIFFAVKSYAYQIPTANFNALMVDFGFIFFFAVAGIFFAFFILKSEKKLLFYALLMLSLAVPFFFAESYLFGFYMPFQWFIYYLTPPLAIFAAVPLAFAAEKFIALYSENKKRIQRIALTVAAVSLIAVISILLVARSDMVYGKAQQSATYYSTSDTKALDAGVWLQQNYPNNDGTVVDTQNPGSWFADFCGKTVSAQTDLSDMNLVAQSVLSLSYNILDPQNMLSAYELKANSTSDENFVAENQVWQRVSSSNMTVNYVSFTENDSQYYFPFSTLSRQIIFNEQSSPAQVEFQYFNQYVMVTETIVVSNDSYPIDVSWTVSPLQSSISNVNLYISYNFDLYFHFDEVQVPGVMDWVNPWAMPSYVHDKDWCYVELSWPQIKNNYIGLYDNVTQAAFAFRFNDSPDWTNIGALANGQIDAIRLTFQLGQINVNQTASREYHLLMITQSSVPSLQPNNVEDLFDYKTAPFSVTCGDYKDYISQNDIQFIVYDKSQLDPTLLNCDFLQLIYHNSEFDIFKVLGNHTSG